MRIPCGLYGYLCMLRLLLFTFAAVETASNATLDTDAWLDLMKSILLLLSPGAFTLKETTNLACRTGILFWPITSPFNYRRMWIDF